MSTFTKTPIDDFGDSGDADAKAFGFGSAPAATGFGAAKAVTPGFGNTSTNIGTQMNSYAPAPAPEIDRTAGAATAVAGGADTLVANTNEDFLNKKWRPMMGWTYMATCIFDFILAPILWAVVQFWETQAANDAFRQWQPLTLQGAGLYHMAMGAVLGIAAYGRTKEKLDNKQA